MTVAAANKTWFPAAFGTVGQIGTYKVTQSADGEESADQATDKGESTICDSLTLVRVGTR